MKDQEFKCSFKSCYKSYCSLNNLRRHFEGAHIGVKRFRCKICRKYLSSKQSLIEHQFMHTGEKPFDCTYPNCSTSFRQGSQLSLHIKMHKEVQKRCNQIKGESKIKEFKMPISLANIICKEEYSINIGTGPDVNLSPLNHPQTNVLLPQLPILLISMEPMNKS